jgi:hypothetical protein
MTNADLIRLIAQAPLTTGYRFELPQLADIPPLVTALAGWFPDIGVGSASCYLQPPFYAQKVWLLDGTAQDNIVLLLKKDAATVGMFACKTDDITQSVYAGLGVAAAGHRGANVAQAGMVFTEALGRQRCMGFVYGMATFRHPYAQRAFERAGWHLVGIMPGYDLEQVAPGTIKRVYEAVYAKSLVPEQQLQRPERCNLTPRAQALFDAVFGG